MRIATRASPLARWQASAVAELLGCPTEIVPVRTAGDERPGVPIGALGARGVFVREVQMAVLDGRAELAVHSAKDLPSGEPGGLVLGAIPARGDPRDALVGARLESLPEGAVVASGSARRRAQLAALRPDLRFVELRGNIATRLGKVPQGGAVVVAACALERLGLLAEAAQVFDVAVIVPQVGQGAIAVECRADDEEVLELLGAIDHAPSRRAVEAERAFLAALGGGCELPVGAHARLVHPGAGEPPELELEGLLARPDGGVVLRRRARGTDPAALGRSLAAELAGEARACGLELDQARPLRDDRGGPVPPRRTEPGGEERAPR